MTFECGRRKIPLKLFPHIRLLSNDPIVEVRFLRSFIWLGWHRFSPSYIRIRNLFNKTSPVRKES
jgi:hypothetical protein